MKWLFASEVVVLEDVELEVTELDVTDDDDSSPAFSGAMSLFSRFKQRTINE